MNRMLEADKIITEIREQEGYHVYWWIIPCGNTTDVRWRP
jgi:hypothetical protein